ncbi:polysaccharide biosynthesis/export family protein [Afifella sp. IM 167]|uniref:polysaccharide biosynthesis/export family protein n=1 Tax=Afifella sp. IM 167 TaxID=2033586 RepID=UPI001CC9F887|nr:polysaccharide biosynthesis/export family protein [Afifella sp. IM 167]MBZ8133291.1 sugar ABC transporter substrate-binding protein [Afifella sp. IM 167]
MTISVSASVARIVAVALVAALGGCQALPRSGPDDDTILKSATTTYDGTDPAYVQGYAVIGLSPNVLAHLSAGGTGSVFSTFGGGQGPAPDIRVGIGDILQVTIFEASTGGLFIPDDAGSRPGNYITLPQQTVDQSGTITVPYAGAIAANGRTIEDIQSEIVRRLANRAIDPQVVVSMVSQRATTASVVGEVRSPSELAISQAGDTVLDLISRAGGISNPGYETFVTLQRRRKKATVFFNTLVNNPRENVYVAPGDIVYVYREQRSFVVLGASGLNGQFNFEAENLSLAEAVGKAGGLLDTRADPGRVFVYRLEDPKTLAEMGVDLTRFEGPRKLIPTIYHANFRKPAEFFLAQDFPMQDKDIIYVSNSNSVEFFKFLELIDTTSATVGGVATDVGTTRDLIRSW